MIYQKAVVAVARKLLVIVWHVLTKCEADRHADPQRVAAKFMAHAYNLSEQRRPAGQSGSEYVRQQLERLGIQLQSFQMYGRTIRIHPADS